MRPRDSTRVEITVEGHLDPRWESEFYGMELVYKSDGTTVIRGPVTDQAALHGLLRRVRDARMTLLAVKHTSKEQKIGRNKMSNIIVFGATGRSGSAVIKQALKAGYMAGCRVNGLESAINKAAGDLRRHYAARKEGGYFT